MGAKTALSDMQLLPANFVPGPHDVICARGKDAKIHPGNQRYTAMIDASLDQYSKATQKYQKSQVVSRLVDAIRSGSSSGGFVKYENGRWYVVGDQLAREKVGQNLRDRLSNIYKSSTKAKRKRWANAQKEIASDMEGMLQNSKQVAGRLDQLSDVIKNGDNVPEVFMSAMFAEANRDILEAMKRDQTLVDNFRKAEEQLMAKGGGKEEVEEYEKYEEEIEKEPTKEAEV